ncbi:MAG: S-layer homology domain-containing protein [Ruminococcaceae bacterium]|nr:S-layer homology domain-containing protein [Oscillospiraceae bacterium]
MLNLKKVIALVCVFALTLTTVAFGATYTDVAEDSAYYEAVETLNKLKIVEGKGEGIFAPEDGVTRAEMAALIARIQGYGETAKANANTAFTDVPADYWASGYIANAAGMGIINGYGDGTFGPEDPVLYEQAVKMIMATLGYTPFAEKNGGYPTGYLAAAQRYDVSLAVANAAVGSEANRGTIAQLLVNAIDTPLMIQARWSNKGEVDYVIADGNTTGYPYQTLMSANLGYVKIRGIVEENTVASIIGTKNIDTTKEAVVTIDVADDYSSTNSMWVKDAPVTEFLVGGTDAEDYLGQSVIAYVEKVGNKWQLVSIAVDTARNKELVIGLDQFSAGGASGTDLKYFKEGSNDTTDAKIHTNDTVENDFAVVVNGEWDSNASVATAVAGKLNYGGQIRLIDNNDLKGYDVAFIDIAYTAVVDEVTKNKIVTKAGVLGDIKYDFEDETKVLKVMKDGAEIDVAELAEFDVLSIYANSKNSNYIVIEVLGSNVVGTITSSKNSKTSQGGVAYKVADTWYDVADGAYKASDLAVGEGGTIYVDQFGKIAAFIEDAALAGGAATNYAYIIAVSGEKSGFGNVDVRIQMLTADGVVVKSLANNAALELGATITKDNEENTIPATKEIKLDLDKWNAGADKEMGTGDDVKGQTIYAEIVGMATNVVQYAANSNGYITKITEAGYDADFVTAGSFAANAEFDSARAKFGSQKVEADAIVFVTASVSQIDKYAVATLDAFKNEDLYTVTVGYQDKKSDAPNVIVIPATELTTSASANVAVVTEAGNSTDAEGNEIYTIKYFIDGEEVTTNTTADVASTVAIPTVGDVVKINITGDAISTLEYVWDFAPVIRDNYDDGSGNAVTLATTTNAVAAKGNYVRSGLETIYGGIVTDCNDDYQISFANDIWTSSAVNNKYLDEAKNVYVIEVGSRSTVIDTGSYRDFSYFEDLYTEAASKLYDAEGNFINKTGKANKVGYGDHVYVREYDGDIIDVVIVKGLLDDVE